MAAVFTISRVKNTDPKVAPFFDVGVGGLPVPPTPVYASNFAAGVDQWGITGAGASRANDTTRAPAALAITGPAYPTYPAGAVATATKLVAGLTVGAQYRLRLFLQTNKGLARIGVQGIGSTAYVSSILARSRVDYLFTATATQHTLTVDVQLPNPYATTTQAKAWIDTITVTPSGTWQGTRLYRTDINGTDVPVRTSPGTSFDEAVLATGGGLRIGDWEAARIGPVTYKVIDGNGVTTVSAAVSHAEARRNLEPAPIHDAVAGTDTWTPSRGTLAVGAGYLRLTITDAQAGAFAQRINHLAANYIPVAPGDVLTVSYDGRSNTGSRMGMLYLFAKADKITLLGGNQAGGYVTVNDTTWTRSSLTLPAAPPEAAYVIVYLGTENLGAVNAVGEWMDFRHVLVEKAAAGDYFDGDTADEPPVYRFWTGTPGASESVETSPAGLRPYLTIPTTGQPFQLGLFPPTTVAPELVLDYEEAREFNGSLHTIIGRADKVANPGPLLLRSGTLDVFAADYAAAAAARDLLTTGATILLTQPNHPGMDMYFIGRTATVRTALVDGTNSRWVCTLAYEQVPRP
jgi:hypothetical protein